MTLDLNPQFETLFLLISSTSEDPKTEVIEELDKLGINGQEFYSKHYRVVEKYTAAFMKKRINSPGAELLQGMDQTLCMLLACLFARQAHWFDTVQDVPEHEILAEVESLLAEMFEAPSTDKLIETLEVLELPSDTKWQIMVLKQHPKKQLEMITAAVKENLPAFEAAKAKVQNPLKVLLTEAEATLNDSEKRHSLLNSEALAPGAPTVPTLALSLLILITENVRFYGLLADRALGNKAEFSKDDFIIGAKALSERSKLEILLALKQGPLYGLEIAEKVGVTPATVSHHINALLLAGFIELEKKDGKVYCQLSPKGIERFLTGATELLLYESLSPSP
ncbi:MAG: winged helix-turn-helix domain-containing protein [Coriobacteriia bacterium]|nr:winged helix-turn-helix domain-containing protein [Coriobacteriia bacterium]MCL2750938.1 winged helix-turn-helix domain-containing protein [Coriobacteriia bacterium]